jgi:ATP-binding cassette, subfamily A (ABC1), member 3
MGYYLNIQVKYFDSTEAMFDYVKDPNYMTDSNSWGGLCFGISMTATGDSTNPNFAEYDFHLHFDDQPKSRYQNIPNQKNPSHDSFQDQIDLNSFSLYTRQGFNLMQNWCANAVLQVETGVFNASIVSMLSPMVTNAITVDKFSAVENQVLPMFMILMYLLPIYRYTSRLVTEKQRKTRELTKLIGVAETPYWLSWALLYTIVVTIISVACSLILVYGVFDYSGFLPMLGFFWLYGMTAFGYILLVQAFFRSNVTMASVVSTLFFFVSTFIDLLVDNELMPEPIVMLASMLPTVAIRRAVATITKLETQRRGLTLGTLNELVYNNRMSTCYIMLVFSCFVLSALGLYVQIVLDTAGGHRKHPCFCFGWDRTKKTKLVTQVDLPPPNIDDFEPVTAVKLLSQEKTDSFLEICDLHKTYDSGKSVVHAVNGLNMKLYQNQIFALLGHNGAGKTTTIQMLTGMLEPSSGSISFLGYDLLRDRELLQSKIGVCPQENVLFDLLSVYEHFVLFASLKSSTGGVLEIEALIKDLDLDEYRDTLAKNLSGGNKRKLQVGLALIGDTKLVLLDEPTAGLDVQARRKMQELLLRYK